MLRPMWKCWGKEDMKYELVLPQCSMILPNRETDAITVVQTPEQVVRLFAHEKRITLENTSYEG